MRAKWKYAIAGGLAGVANGFFGGGGGSVFVPLLTGYCKLDQRKAFATSVAVILPLCVLSVAVYLFRGGLDVMAALPYLIGGTVGGWAGGKWFRGVKMPWLKRAFGLLSMYETEDPLFREAVVHMAELMETWNEEHMGEIVLDENAAALIARMRS